MTWVTFNLANGGSADLFAQALNCECGPACVLTFAGLVGHSVGSIGKVRSEVRNIEGSGVVKGFNKSWQSDGSTSENLQTAMCNLGLSGAYLRKTGSTTRTRRHCEKATRKRPMILKVSWLTAKCSHFVVCIGKDGTNRDFVEILDPWWGLQTLAPDDDGEWYYTPTNQNGNVVATATIWSELIDWIK